jgi:Tol biopolymer transport system component
MKRILIFCGAVALPAMVGVSTLRDADEGGAAGTLMEQQDTSVIVRRVYEGVLPEFWMNGPSPDGRYVTQNGWDTGDLAVLDLLSGQRRRVTQKGEGGWETSFAFSETSRFSPDGQRIAYSWFTEPGTYELRVIHVDGTNDRMVTRAGFEPEDPPPSYSSFYEWWPDLHGWSPDGQHILATLYYGEEKQELTLLSVADGSREVLHVKEGPDAFAAISPDGYYLAYGEMEDVFVQPLRGGDAVAVASGPSKDVLLGWTEQGSLLYLSDRELTEGVWRVPMRNGRPAGEAVLVAGDLWGMQPMGVAGNSLFYGIQSGAPRLHVVSLDLTRNRISGPPTPIEPQIRESSYPAWSPDGERLVYWVGRGKEARLILRSTGGTESRDVTPPSLTHDWDEIRWSQDGRCILISGTERESGREGYFAYTLATGEIEYLFSSADYKPQPGAIYQESFSHDWGTAYLPMTESSPMVEGPLGPFSLLRVDIAGGAEQELLSRPARTEADASPPFRLFVPSPDDHLLAFWETTEPDTARMLRVMSTDGGNPRTLLTETSTGPAPAFSCGAGRHIPLWTSDGRYLLTVLRDSVPTGSPSPPNPCKVYRVPVAGGEPSFVGAIPPHGPPSTWALSPDDSRLVFQTGEDRGEIWILQGLEGR